MDKKIIQKSARYFTNEERHSIIQEMLSNNCTKQEIWKKYTGEKEEHGGLLRWMRSLGYPTQDVVKHATLVSNVDTMPRKNKIEAEENSFENLQLKKRVAALEKQLKDAELKAIAFSTMVDIAEKEFKIPIRKKLNTKP